MWTVAALNIPAISFFNQFHSIALYLVYENQLIGGGRIGVDGERLELELDDEQTLLDDFIGMEYRRFENWRDTHTERERHTVRVPMEIDELIWAWNKNKHMKRKKKSKKKRTH